jgi:antirestriction protein ArdC
MPISQVTSGTPLNGDFKPRGIIRMSALCVLCRYRHNGHWTSAESRCDRQLGKRFGDHAYAMEELVAELGAAFLCADLQITDEPRADHAQYLASWLSVMKEDKKAIFTAASKASEAAAFLAGLQGA